MFNLNLDARGAVKSIDRGFSDFWYANIERLNNGLPSGVTAKTVYETVGILKRALEIIYQKTATYPFEIMIGTEVVTDKPEYASILSDWHRLIAQTVITYYLKPGAYWYISTDSKGRNVTPVLLQTNEVTPYDDLTELKGFYYYGRLKDPNTGQPIPHKIPPERMIWFWEFDPDNRFRPGPERLYSVLANAGVIWAMDRLAAAFFNRGGVPVTLMPIPPGTDANSEKKFQDFLDRLASGIRNAFKMLAVRFDIKPVVLGQPLKDMQAEELYRLHKYSILEDIGIPPSIVNSESAHDATASADMAKLYLDLIIPLWEMMAAQVNKKIFEAGKSEARIVGQPDRIEALQDMFLAQAKAVREASGEYPMTLEEGRSVLELPELPGAEKDTAKIGSDQLPQILSVAEAVGGRKITPEQAAAILQAGFPQLTNAQITAMTTPPEKPEPAPVVVAPPAPPQAETEEQEPEMEEAEADGEEVTKALAQWRKLILDNLKHGTSLADAPVAAVVPHKITSAIDFDIPKCKTASDIRAVFDKHWPKPKPQKSAVPPQVLTLLERAVKLQEEQKQ